MTIIFIIEYEDRDSGETWPTTEPKLNRIFLTEEEAKNSIAEFLKGSLTKRTNPYTVSQWQRL